MATVDAVTTPSKLSSSAVDRPKSVMNSDPPGSGSPSSLSQACRDHHATLAAFGQDAGDGGGDFARAYARTTLAS